MNQIKNKLPIRTHEQDASRQYNDRNSPLQRCSTSIHNSIDVYRKTHAMTFHISNQEKSFSSQSQQSESNVQYSHRRATSNIINPIKKQKTLQYFSYITQILMPDYEKNINTISLIEGKVYKNQNVNKDDHKQKQNLNFGECWINYNFENHPIELQSDFVNVQKLRQWEFYYYKIRCQDKVVPLSFTMNQTNQTKFKIFLSTTNPFPSKFSSEYIFQVKTWKYDCKDYKYFPQTFIYISVVFALETTIKISFSFGSTQKTLAIQKSPKTKSTIIKQNLTKDNSTGSYLLNQKTTNLLQKGRNLIQGNILNVAIYNNEDYKIQKQAQKKLQETKFNEVINKRKQFEINTQGQKQINYFTTEITHLLKKLKYKKQQKYLDQNGHLKSKIQFEIFRLIAYLQWINLIYEKLQHQHQIINHFQKIQTKMTKIYFRAKGKICKMKGYTLYGRIHLDVKFCLNMFAKQIKKKGRIQIINTIQSILSQRSFLWNFQQQIHYTSRQLQSIKESIYNFTLRYRVYRQFLKLLFEKHFDSYCQKYIINKERKIQQCFEFWHQNSKYLMYFQYLSKQFAIIYGRQNLNDFFSIQRQHKQIIYQKIGQPLSLESKIQENHQIIHLFKVPLQQDFFQILPILYEQTKQEVSQYCKDSIRRPFNKLQF